MFPFFFLFLIIPYYLNDWLAGWLAGCLKDPEEVYGSPAVLLKPKGIPGLDDVSFPISFLSFRKLLEEMCAARLLIVFQWFPIVSRFFDD